MPTFHGYHGDFQNSNNSSWDQIQASLKILLPTYQPILIDSESSILQCQSIHKQTQLYEEIKQSLNRICATLNEMIQEEEQADADADSKIKKLECEIGEGDAAMVQNATEVTDPAPIQQSDLENPSEINEDKFKSQSEEDEDEFDERSNYFQFDDMRVAVVVQRPPPEPQDSNLLEVRKKKPAPGEEMSRRPAKVTDTMTGIHNHTE
ncbi:hypothetical protein PIB30_101333, partial [Stylosanthes scabra]|nr:hypothetical protein [Stylosanthes scabra]